MLVPLSGRLGPGLPEHAVRTLGSDMRTIEALIALARSSGNGIADGAMVSDRSKQMVGDGDMDTGNIDKRKSNSSQLFAPEGPVSQTVRLARLARAI